MKYSFIIPVYNGANYIDRCLTSVLNQLYKNFEIIIINDGSTDGSFSILESYKKKHPQTITLINQINKGLSVSRNIGIKKAVGDYIIFVDIDDYISIETLTFLEKQLTTSVYDLIKFEWSNSEECLNLERLDKQELNGHQAICYLIKNKYIFEMAVLYAYNKKYLNKIKFFFEKNRYHEDFGLIPITILKSDSILLTSKKLYYYDQNVIGSISSKSSYNQELKKAADVLHFAIKLKHEIQEMNNNYSESNELLLSYNANAVLRKRKNLIKKDKKAFDKKIRDYNLINDLYSKTLKDKIKKKIVHLLISKDYK